MSSKRIKSLAQELRKRAPSKAYEQGFGQNGGVASLGTTYEDLDSDGVPDTIVKNSPRIGAFKRAVGVVNRSYLGSSASGVSVGFNIDVQDTMANIIARSGDAVGVIAFVTTGANQYDIMVYDGANWQIYYNN